MQKDHYLGYIAHFVRNVDQLTTDSEYRAFFIKHLGTSNVINAPDLKIRDTARLMYRAYAVSLYIRYSPYYLMTKLSFAELGEMMGSLMQIVDQYDLYKSVEGDVSISSTDKHIKKYALDTYRSILAKYSPAPKVKTTKKTSAAAKKTVRKPAARPTTKASSKKGTTAKRSTAPKGKSCSDYNLTELKGMAKTKKIVGYSRMNKSNLCTALNIKIA